MWVEYKNGIRSCGVSIKIGMSMTWQIVIKCIGFYGLCIKI